uniref:ANK_REP_REGION domain-containing protein n=1 Tax=Macrostomum lignano TaxID=282301 RepID=A0A1I8GKV1_9PLAT
SHIGTYDLSLPKRAIITMDSRPVQPCISSTYRLRRSASSDRAYRAVRFALVDIPASDSPSPDNRHQKQRLRAGLPRGQSVIGISGLEMSTSQASPKASILPQQRRKTDGATAATAAAADAGEFIAAVQRGDVQSVLRLLGRTAGQHNRYPMSSSAPKVNVNTQLKNGMSALHQAAFNGNLAIMQVLLENESAVDLQDSR